MISRKTGHTFSLILFALFIVALLGLLMCGARIYQSITTTSNTLNQQRVTFGLLKNAVKSLDSADSIQAGIGPEGIALVLSEKVNSETYETRIYSYAGNIVSEYASATSPYSPSKADIIAPSKSFWFSLKPELLTIVTDYGETNIALRSKQNMGGSF